QRIIPPANLKAWDLLGDGQLQLYLMDEKTNIESLPAETVQAVMDNPLYWMFCWASGKVLAQEILQNPAWVKGKTVMDVGTGSGVVAIACALAGAKRVIASDIDDVSQKAVKLNLQLNGLADVDHIQIMGDYRQYQGHVDLIVIADVLYEEKNIPLLEDLLKRSDEMILVDSRVKNFSYPGLEKTATFDGCTFPHLGGFDEFFEVNLYRSIRD
ncbi:MAG: methyltransferase, partial [Pseudomonadales bacterium]|nr:methyltransferase [Pseudomonadales bacterium]